jgi:hypothetical protein
MQRMITITKLHYDEITDRIRGQDSLTRRHEIVQ